MITSKEWKQPARRSAEFAVARCVAKLPYHHSERGNRGRNLFLAIQIVTLRGAAAYRLSWFDAHLWSYAEHYGLSELISEDFQHDRLYGTVRAVNPFSQATAPH